MCKAFGWSLHFSFRNTKIAVLVVAGVGMVTSLPPAAPARTELISQLLFPCSIAGSSYQPPGILPALDPGFPANQEPPSCHSPFRVNTVTHRLSSEEGRSELTQGRFPTAHLNCSARRRLNVSQRC